jgi:hypothetical protein
MNIIEKLADQAKNNVPEGIEVTRWIEIYNENLVRLVIDQCIDIIYNQEHIPSEFFYAKSARQHEYAIRNYFNLQK